MSMNDPHSEQFQAVRQLLALKRHEQPHPRYFTNFSRQVIARIEAGEHPANLSWRERWQAPWLQRLWAAFETKPVLAGSVGLAACALLIGGVVASDQDHSAAVNIPPSSAVAFEQISPNLDHKTTLQPAAPVELSRLNSLAPQSGGSLFGEIQRLQSRPFQGGPENINVLFRIGD